MAGLVLQDANKVTCYNCQEQFFTDYPKSLNFCITCITKNKVTK